MKKRKKVNRKKWIIQQMRRLSMKWPPHFETKKENRRSYYKTKKDGTKYKKPNFEYQCNHCNEWFGDSKVQVDHVNPVVEVEGYDHLSEEEFIGKFAISLFCDHDNLQILCLPCHTIKSNGENATRRDIKKKNKEKS